jgi:hypothetical protein
MKKFIIKKIYNVKNKIYGNNFKEKEYILIRILHLIMKI